MTHRKVDLENMSPDERLELIETIWTSLSPADVRLTPAQQQELERRLEDFEKNPDEGVSWAEAKRRIRAPKT